jgi:Uma2 family endonuclease
MNVAWTQAAEGLPRRAFTVEDVWRMIEIGIIGQDEKFELIEGEIVPVSPSHDPHERIKSGLILVVPPRLPTELWFGVESSIYLGQRTFVEPDFCIFPRKIKSHDVKGSDLLLVIEVADSSLSFDLGKKAQLYARYGAQELWVIDAKTRVTTAHIGSTASGWTEVREVGPDEELTSTKVPQVRLRMADLNLE